MVVVVIFICNGKIRVVDLSFDRSIIIINCRVVWVKSSNYDEEPLLSTRFPAIPEFGGKFMSTSISTSVVESVVVGQGFNVFGECVPVPKTHTNFFPGRLDAKCQCRSQIVAGK